MATKVSIKRTLDLTKGNDSDWTISKTEFERLVREHKGTLDDVLVTPVMADWILKTYNTGNRHLRVNHANSFADVLKQGDYINTGASIVFAHEGILNNGQHRLEGIRRSGVAALCDLRFGIPRKAFPSTDTGVRRIAGDVLSISGSGTPYATAAAIKLLLSYESGLPNAYLGRGRTIPNAAILAGYDRWRPDIDNAIALTHRKIPRRGFLNASSNAFSFLAIRQTDEESVEEFLGLVESGLTKTKNDAPRLLRERLMTDPNFVRGDREAILERFALFIKAWNFWRKGERPASLRWRMDETFPTIKGAKL